MQIVKLLLEASADPYKADVSSGMVPLHFAMRAGQTECIQHLLKKMGSIDVKDGEGNTPLAFAARHASPSLGRLLLNHHDRLAVHRHIDCRKKYRFKMPKNIRIVYGGGRNLAYNEKIR